MENSTVIGNVDSESILNRVKGLRDGSIQNEAILITQAMNRVSEIQDSRRIQDSGIIQDVRLRPRTEGGSRRHHSNTDSKHRGITDRPSSQMSTRTAPATLSKPQVDHGDSTVQDSIKRNLDGQEGGYAAYFKHREDQARPQP